MGLFQKAVETFNAHSNFIGVAKTGEQPLVPVSHSLVRADIEVRISQDGKFKGASIRAKDDAKIIIPVTEESGGRSGKNPLPHPLCDKLDYIAPGDGWKHERYIEQLTDWAESEYSHPMIRAILKYVKCGTVMDDLVSQGLVSLDEKDLADAFKKIICWRVLGIGDEWGACWENQGVFRSFIDWYASKLAERRHGLCMISGEAEPVAENNPKGVVPFFGNAKLISANDDRGFTFRGRFKSSFESATVGYEASQKAHNALRWLIGNQGTSADFRGRTFICWNPKGKKVVQAWSPFVGTDEISVTPTDYRRKLQRALEGYLAELPEEEGVVIAAFDAATSGRLSLVYFNELAGSDYLQRLKSWDEACCWGNGKFGIQSPRLRDIVSFSFGSPRREGEKTQFIVDDKLMRMHMQRLIRCRVDRARLPVDFKDALVERAANAPLYDTSTAIKVSFIACAVIRKYMIDYRGEDVGMALDEQKHDRSYQFGRLLAVLDAVERATFDSSEKGRMTNAERYRMRFRRRPMNAATLIHGKLEPYFRRLERLGRKGSRIFYQREIEQIFEQITQFPDDEIDKPLADTYLIGYYLERGKLYPRHSENNENKAEEEE